MSTIKVPFDDIQGQTTSGTWTYVGTGSTGAAPLPPDPPTLYDYSIDFAGVGPGSYPYQY